MVRLSMIRLSEEGGVSPWFIVRLFIQAPKVGCAEFGVRRGIAAFDVLLSYPNSCLGTGCLRNSVSAFEKLRRETEFRGAGVPKHEFGTEKRGKAPHNP